MGQKILVVLSLCSKRLSCGIYWFKISVCDVVSEFNDDICKEKVLHTFTQGIIGQLKSSLNSQSAFQFFLSRIEIAEKIEQLFASACDSNIIHDAKIYEKQ